MYLLYYKEISSLNQATKCFCNLKEALDFIYNIMTFIMASFRCSHDSDGELHGTHTHTSSAPDTQAWCEGLCLWDSGEQHRDSTKDCCCEF